MASIDRSSQILNQAEAVMARYNSSSLEAYKFSHGWYTDKYMYTCTGFDDSERCNNAWISWMYGQQITRTESYTTAVQTSVFVTIETQGNGKRYTDCDGIPRFRFSDGPITTITKTISMIRDTTIWSVTSSQLYTEFVYPSNRSFPHCYPSPQFCSRLNYDFISKLMIAATQELGTATIARPFQEPCREPPFDQESYCSLYTESEVILFYWPPALTSRDICAAEGYGTAMTLNQNISSVITHVTSAITFAGQDLYLSKVEPRIVQCWGRGCASTLVPGAFPICLGECYDDIDAGRPKSSITWISSSVFSGPFTFTYPNVYLAHRPIYRGFGDHTWAWGPVTQDTMIRSAGIIKLRSDDIYSEHRTYRNPERGVDFAQRVANGEFRPRFSPNDIDEHFETDGKVYLPYSLKPFNFGHLNDPVPASVFYDARYEDCWGSQSHCGTITHGHYRPRIALKNHVWFSLFPEHFSCDIKILNDPPRAITALPLPTLDPPYIPKFHAQPGAAASPSWSMPTGLPPTTNLAPYDDTDEKHSDDLPASYSNQELRDSKINRLHDGSTGDGLRGKHVPLMFGLLDSNFPKPDQRNSDDNMNNMDNAQPVPSKTRPLSQWNAENIFDSFSDGVKTRSSERWKSLTHPGQSVIRSQLTLSNEEGEHGTTVTEFPTTDRPGGDTKKPNSAKGSPNIFSALWWFVGISSVLLLLA
jgi:hypothetical protein